jgi:hypothetical protein
MPPSTKEEMAATITAAQLIDPMSIKTVFKGLKFVIHIEFNFPFLQAKTKAAEHGKTGDQAG